MLFARANQQVEIDGGQMVSLWETWPSDDDTFKATARFDFASMTRGEIEPVVAKQDLAGKTGVMPPDPGSEEVTRNEDSYTYLVDNGLTTAKGVSAYINGGNKVDLPIGSFEIKAKWNPVSADTDGAYIYVNGGFALTGMHVMFKMAATPTLTPRGS